MAHPCLWQLHGERCTACLPGAGSRCVGLEKSGRPAQHQAIQSSLLVIDTHTHHIYILYTHPCHARFSSNCQPYQDSLNRKGFEHSSTVQPGNSATHKIIYPVFSELAPLQVAAVAAAAVLVTNLSIVEAKPGGSWFWVWACSCAVYNRFFHVGRHRIVQSLGDHGLKLGRFIVH